VYVADCFNNTIRKITPAGQVSTWLGKAGAAGFVDGAGASARLNCPLLVVSNAHDELYVVDQESQAIRKVSPAGVVTTLSRANALTGGPGTAGVIGQVDGLAVDQQGFIYVTDATRHTVLKLTPDGSGVSLLAGQMGQAGHVDGQGTVARFSSPQGLAIDAQGKLYVADQGNQQIRQITPDGVVTTLAGSGKDGDDDGAAASATFHSPWAVAVDEAGNVYVSEVDVHLVRKISPTGTVATVVGQRGRTGFVPGELPGVIQQPIGLLARGGLLYVSFDCGVARVKLPQ
jgi:sugar lactone lactonase YvrE